MALEHLNAVFILRVGSGETQRLTNSNPWLDGVAMGRQEVIEYPTRDDAYQIEGILIYPVDYVEGTDRKSTRLNSSHVAISYAVFCLKKKKGRKAGGIVE